MPASKRIALNNVAPPTKATNNSQQLFLSSRANEIFIAVVGPAGAGVGTAATALKRFLEDVRGDDGNHFDVHIVKASDSIARWAGAKKRFTPSTEARKSIDDRIAMQNLGDEFRKDTRDNAAVMRGVVEEIREMRSRASGLDLGEVDGKPRAFIIESLRHPAEAHFLRRLYQDAFHLVGVVCEPEKRKRRLLEKLFDKRDRTKSENILQVESFMERDANAPEKYGQHVADAFQEADFFVDNSIETEDVDETGMNDALRRFLGLVTGKEVFRPTTAETAMNDAHSAQLRSACMSRQVGAALVDAAGNVVATGTNEVPKAGGGLYGESFRAEEIGHDHRCLFRETKFCSSNKEQNEIIEELFEQFPELVVGKDRGSVFDKVRRTRLGGLIEFSRAVHAEMDAILSAARIGVSPQGCRLFVTTFPCHYCARHIVSAGITEVQYIEPYPKSRAQALHGDSITMDSSIALRKEAAGEDALVDGKVLFRPFVGVAPRMYRHVFLKDRDYKNRVTGVHELGVPEWATFPLFTKRYTELEEELVLDNPS
ncbi:MAG: deoxycytidylate deaminase [Mesorhizobium sp.]|nr:MAG: deoxycytidylate deaminase [Mesorhizobium sp.]